MTSHPSSSPNSDTPAVVDSSHKKPELKTKKHTPMQHTIASQGAGAFATIFFFPFDTVKMRFMSQDGTKQRMHNNHNYSSTFKSLLEIRATEGIRSLYRGSATAIAGSMTAWGSYMFLYRSLTTKYVSGDEFFAKAGVSAIASVTSSSLSTPIFLIKTRMQVEDRSGAGGPTHYTTFAGSLSHILKTTGVRSLWRGFSAQCLLAIPNAFNLPIYDALKKHRMQSTHKEELDMHEVLACTLVTKTTLLLISHPLFVLKTRLQDHRSDLGDVKYLNVVDSVKTILKREGVKGLYRGTAPALVQAVPRAITHFFVYEALLKFQKHYY
jgi:hypothetical protein